MADLGQLNAYRDDYDFSFSAGKKKYRVKPSIDAVLDYRRTIGGITQGNKGATISQTTIWEITAPLLGGKFNTETYRFEAGEEDDENANLLTDLIASGVDYTTLDRLLSSVYAKYQFGDEVAEELMRVGDLGKALRNLRERREAEAEKATQKDTGETNETD